MSDVIQFDQVRAARRLAAIDRLDAALQQLPEGQRWPALRNAMDTVRRGRPHAVPPVTPETLRERRDNWRNAENRLEFWQRLRSLGHIAAAAWEYAGN